MRVCPENTTQRHRRGVSLLGLHGHALDLANPSRRTVSLRHQEAQELQVSHLIGSMDIIDYSAIGSNSPILIDGETLRSHTIVVPEATRRKALLQ